MRARIDRLMLFNLLLLLLLLVEEFNQGVVFALVGSILGLMLFIHELFVFHGVGEVKAEAKAKVRMRRKVIRSGMQTIVIIAIAVVYVLKYKMPLLDKLLETLF